MWKTKCINCSLTQQKGSFNQYHQSTQICVNSICSSKNYNFFFHLFFVCFRTVFHIRCCHYPLIHTGCSYHPCLQPWWHIQVDHGAIKMFLYRPFLNIFRFGRKVSFTLFDPSPSACWKIYTTWKAKYRPVALFTEKEKSCGCTEKKHP